MKTVQFNANNILCGNNYPIAKDLVIISTGHDDSIIDDSMGYSEYIIPILEAIQKTSIKVYRLYLASITSTVTDYKGTHTWVFTTGTTYSDADIEYIQAALYNVFCENNETCEPIVNYANNTFIITDIYSC
nr:MAG: hypothetical protein [Bacteriophage sp.]